jgi:hypothetical protein
MCHIRRSPLGAGSLKSAPLIGPREEARLKWGVTAGAGGSVEASGCRGPLTTPNATVP